MAIFTAIGTALGAATGAALATGAAAVGAGVVGVSSLASASAQRKQAATANRIATEERRRSIRQNIRQAQVTRARAVMSAQGSGTLNSSGAAGGIGAIQSNLGSALGYSSQMSSLQTQYNNYGQRASNWNAVGSIGSSLFSAGANSGGLNFLFPQQQQAQPYASLDYMENRS